MRRLLNTLFVTSEDAYLTLDGENIVVRRDKEEAGRFPLHNLEEIVSFSYAGASPALMGACTKRNIGLSFCTPSGRVLARTAGVEPGNVLLRREQYRVADDPAASCRIAKLMIWGKLYMPLQRSAISCRRSWRRVHSILCVVWRARLRRFTLRYSTI